MIEQTAFQEQIAARKGDEVRKMISVYEERGIEKGIVQGKQETLLLIIRSKFGEPPESIKHRIDAVSNTHDLDLLTESSLSANTLSDFERQLK